VVLRTAYVAPDLIWQWRRPALADLRLLLGNSIGAWFGMIGWQFIAASNSFVIAYLGHPEWVPIYACTAKLGVLLMQLGWVLPDSGLVGLAQLHGEQPGSRRLTDRIEAVLQLHLLLAGVTACGVLAFNPAFVRWWVGEAFFGGLPLNTLLAFSIVTSSLAHGLMTATSVIGRRLPVGVVTLGNAAMQVAGAVALGRRWGLPGIAVAAVLSTMLISVPGGMYLVRSTVEVTVRRLAGALVIPWLWRAAPLAATAFLIGFAHRSTGVWVAAMASLVIAALYVRQMRPFYLTLPLDPRWVRWLVSLRLLPHAPAVSMESP
jgi:O-antigen/teichoic acid export membrane protein